jgi:uncharacterized protein YndB with AHSA1/START domain
MTNKTATNLGELTITREYDAPREMVFRAMIEPEQLTHFWGPTGTHAPLESIVLEPWAGGRFETTIVPDGALPDAGFTMKAVFVEIVERAPRVQGARHRHDLDVDVHRPRRRPRRS